MIRLKIKGERSISYQFSYLGSSVRTPLSTNLCMISSDSALEPSQMYKALGVQISTYKKKKYKNCTCSMSPPFLLLTKLIKKYTRAKLIRTVYF